MAKKINFKPRICRSCHEEFIPKSGAGIHCSKCKERNVGKSKKKMSKLPSYKNLSEGTTRGQAVRSTPLSIRLEENVAKRVERMK